MGYVHLNVSMDPVFQNNFLSIQQMDLFPYEILKIMYIHKVYYAQYRPSDLVFGELHSLREAAQLCDV